jgi:hypothetical protein
MWRVREIHASVRGELMTAAVALERAAGASWTSIGAAQDPPVSRQAVQQRYRLLVRRADVTSDGDTVAKPTPVLATLGKRRSGEGVDGKPLLISCREGAAPY